MKFITKNKKQLNQRRRSTTQDGHTENKSRRVFFYTMGATVASLLLPAQRVMAKKLALSLKKIPDLQEVGGSTTLEIKGQKVLFVRDTQTTVRAINPICTHKKCTVAFRATTGKLFCKCHKSGFDVRTGAVLEGPAPEPLTVFPTRLRKDKLLIKLPDEPKT